MNIGIIGLGYWGPNLLRNFAAQTGAVGRLTCCDINELRINNVRPFFPSVEFTLNADDILRSTKIDAVVIATPVATHFDFAQRALREGKHVFIEKPMTLRSADAEKLLEMAEARNLKIMVDHTFVFTGAVRKIKEVHDNGELGDIIYFDSVRVNLGLFQHDVNVIWDLATHDISIMDYIIPARPISVSALGIHHINNLEDVAYITLFLENNIIAHLHVNWLAPVKVRTMLIGGNKKMVVYNDMETSEKVKIYDKGVDIITKEGVYQTLIQYRTGDMRAPKIDQTEALSLAVGNFIEAVDKGSEPITNGQAGLRVVKILEAAQISLKNEGKLIKLN
jgi:predicted dehydrogenase